MPPAPPENPEAAGTQPHRNLGFDSVDLHGFWGDVRGLNEVPGAYRNEENSMSLMFSRGLNSNSLIGGGGGAGASNFLFD